VPTPVTVTATAGGSVANGLLLRVKVLTGTSVNQFGATAVQSSSVPAAHQASITTTVTGSQVYGAITSGSAAAQTPAASTTMLDNVVDATNGECYATLRTTAATGTPGAITVGASAPSQGGGVALAEILPSGTLAEDPSSPAAVSTTSGTTVTSASFTPPDGSLLVAMVASDGGSGTTTMALSGGGLTWTPLAEANSSVADYAGVWIAQTGPPDPNDPVITATQGGSTAAGMAMRVFVLTQAAATQNGGTSNSQFVNVATFTQAVTTTQTGSRVYGASSHFPNAAASAAAATTVVDDVADATNNGRYTTFKATSLTGTPGATTLGYTVSGTNTGPFAQAEIKTAGTLAEDASAPPVASTTAATFVSCAGFTPPPGSLLVILIASDGGAAVTTMSVSGGGLTYIELVRNNPSAGDYAGVWIAQVPAGGSPENPAPAFGPGWHPGAGLPGMPGGTPFWMPVTPGSAPLAAAAPQVPSAQRGFPVRAPAPGSPAGRVTSRAGTPQATRAAPRALDGPVQARALPPRGGQTDNRTGPFAGTGPALKALAAVVSARLRVLPPRGRTTGRAGIPGGTGPVVRPLAGPVRAVRQPPPPGGRVTGIARAAATVVTPTAGPPVWPLHGPVQSRRQPQRGGSISRAAGPYDGTGPQLRAPDGPMRAQPAARRGGSVANQAGTFTAVTLGAGPPLYPAHGPVQARRLPQRGGHVTRAAGTFAGTGTPARALGGPVKARPPLPRGGHAASRAGTFTAASLTPGPLPQGHPAQAKRLGARGGSVSHRSGTYAGTGPAVPPLKQPLGRYRTQPPPPARGRVMSLHGPVQGSGPPVAALRRAVRARLPVPVLTGRNRSTLPPPVATPPPTFVMGAGHLIAAPGPAGTLAAGGPAGAIPPAAAAGGTTGAGGPAGDTRSTGTAGAGTTGGLP
jgi:hypothetical protein